MVQNDFALIINKMRFQNEICNFLVAIFNENIVVALWRPIEQAKFFKCYCKCQL